MTAIIATAFTFIIVIVIVIALTVLVNTLDRKQRLIVKDERQHKYEKDHGQKEQRICNNIQVCCTQHPKQRCAYYERY